MKKLAISVILFIAFMYACSLDTGNQDPLDTSSVIAPASISLGAYSTDVSAAATYAVMHWNWWRYTNGGKPFVNEEDAQPQFQCAEFVARSLSTLGYFPGLESSSSLDKSKFSFNKYLGSYNLTYVPDLYSWLVGKGCATINNSTQPQAGDVIFYKNTKDGNYKTYKHVAIITPVNGSPSYATAHNVALLNKPYDSKTWFNFPYFDIAHIKHWSETAPAWHAQTSSSSIYVSADSNSGPHKVTVDVSSGGTCTVTFYTDAGQLNMISFTYYVSGEINAGFQPVSDANSPAVSLDSMSSATVTTSWVGGNCVITVSGAYGALCINNLHFYTLY
jgi:hypothetical protein